MRVWLVGMLLWSSSVWAQSMTEDVAAIRATVADYTEEVVVDGPLVTSRKPEDLPAFNREAVALFTRGGKKRP